MQDENGEVILVGKCWSPDVSDWDKEDIVLRIPKRDEDKEEYEDFSTQQRNMHYEGVKEAHKIVRKYLPKEFEDLLIKNESWTCPYHFRKPEEIKLKTGQALPASYNMLDFSLADHISHSKATHDAENVMETEDVLIEKEEAGLFPSVENGKNDNEIDFPTTSNDEKKEEIDEEETDEETDEEDKTKPTTQSNKKLKWYLQRNGESVHINRALKLILPREYISKERSRRHWVSKHLPLMNPIASDHNVIRFRDVAIVVGKSFDLLHIVSIQSEDGKELTSTKSTHPGT
ncbi:hypothetical protein OS493_038710 [Desmophyllum pertusum]|uniref:Uncharacterized protein n=1 Tax=Desmophyllum pertusum TaxID=174260 RepID=A0A9W9ZI27_9CNID|nr:hypothetical protein OS493_038710 [Desmophyllum pertusum]